MNKLENMLIYSERGKKNSMRYPETGFIPSILKFKNWLKVGVTEIGKWTAGQLAEMHKRICYWSFFLFFCWEKHNKTNVGVSDEFKRRRAVLSANETKQNKKKL